MLVLPVLPPATLASDFGGGFRLSEVGLFGKPGRLAGVLVFEDGCFASLALAFRVYTIVVYDSFFNYASIRTCHHMGGIVFSGGMRMRLAS